MPFILANFDHKPFNFGKNFDWNQFGDSEKTNEREREFDFIHVQFVDSYYVLLACHHARMNKSFS